MFLVICLLCIIIILLVIYVFYNNKDVDKNSLVLEFENKIREKLAIEYENKIREKDNLNKELLEYKARLEERISNLNRELDRKQDYYEIKAENVTFNDRLKQQKEYIEKLKEEMNLSFRNLSNEIVKQQKQDFSEQQKILLKPFENQIKDFQLRIDEINKISIENRVSFEEQIKNLSNNSINLAKEAQDLTNALKGNKKLQGNWGEIQLENLLEITGLNEGIDYVKQETFKNEDGKIHRPDYIINLPNDRRIVIDSKVSLNNYINYVSSNDELEKQQYLKNYIDDIRNHIKELATKEYYKELKKSVSLDYVFMFIPLERAYIDALDNCKNDIYKFSFDNKIAIVTPSSLMPILKAIEYLWNIEIQNKNIEKIIKLAGRIYEKVAYFKSDIEKIGKSIDDAKKVYFGAMNKVYNGNGNVFKTVDELRKYGVKVNKKLLLNSNEDNDDNENNENSEGNIDNKNLLE